MSDHIHKSHNKSLLLYHFVCPIKYRRKVLSSWVSDTFKEICLQIEERYEIHFVEIGFDEDHVHFLIQSVPSKSVSFLIKMIKSITAREVFKLHPGVKKILWGGSFWSSGYFVNTVSKFGDENSISKYVRDQGLEKEYSILHKSKQLALFWFRYPYACIGGSSFRIPRRLGRGLRGKF